MNSKLHEHFNCDSCFMFCAKVHRCSQCLTKLYCSAACLRGDWESGHKELCKERGPDRKIKAGTRDRKKKGQESMDKYELPRVSQVV
jgi:hypothetical protein